MLSWVNTITFLWILFWTLVSLRRLRLSKKESIDFVMPIFLIFCGLPLLLDVIIGKPYYSTQPGFAAASTDHATSYVYCAYVAFISPLWVIMGSSHHASNYNPAVELDYKGTADKIYNLSRRPTVYLALFTLLIAPIVIALNSPDYMQYLTYSSVLRYSVYNQFDEWHSYVALFTVLSVLSGTYLLLMSTNPILSLSNCIRIYPFILIASWLNGKRAILALVVALIVVAGWVRNEFRGRKLLLVSLLGAFMVFGFSFAYQEITGRIETQSWYENFRIDFGRDAVIKMAIYAELNPQQIQILEHRLQSCIFYATVVVPRQIWPEKPLPYAQYATSAMLATAPRLWGWGITTSILDESIANAGWWGFLVGPLIIILICRIGDRSNSPLTRLLTPLIGSLLLTVQVVAFAPIFAIWVGAHALTAHRCRKESRLDL